MYNVIVTIILAGAIYYIWRLRKGGYDDRTKELELRNQELELLYQKKSKDIDEREKKLEGLYEKSKKVADSDKPDNISELVDMFKSD